MSDATTVAVPPSTYQTLRPRFKQRQADTNNVYQNWQIRVHRSLSWLKRAEELPQDQPDVQFMLLWIALNALYSRWDNQRNCPAHEAEARGRFVQRVCEMDSDSIGQFLQRHRGLVRKLLEDPFLSPIFWRDPDDPKSKGRAAQDANYLERNLKNRDFCRLLEQVSDRLYVLRGQLMHGAATGGGKLNRKTLNYCLQMLKLFVPLAIHVVVEHGAHDQWPDLCYPPLK